VSELEIFTSAGDGLDVSYFGLTDAGVAYVVAGPFAKAMGYRQTKNALDQLDAAEKGFAETETPGGKQRVSVIYEDGIWELIFRSTLPSAKSMKARVKEILRQLRQTGVVDMRSQKELTRREILQMALEAEDRAELAKARVAELEPKADLADTFLISDGSSRLVREAAKLLSMREKDLRRFLLDERLIFPKHAPCGDVSYDFYADFAHHFVAKETVVNHTWGSCSHYTLRITARGIELIKKRLSGRDAA
jgi:anti-repressor protein